MSLKTDAIANKTRHMANGKMTIAQLLSGQLTSGQIMSS